MPRSSSVRAAALIAASTYVGPLRATNESFNYDMAPGGGAYHSIVVSCRPITVLVTWADLDRA